VFYGNCIFRLGRLQTLGRKSMEGKASLQCPRLWFVLFWSYTGVVCVLYILCYSIICIVYTPLQYYMYRIYSVTVYALNSIICRKLKNNDRILLYINIIFLYYITILYLIFTLLKLLMNYIIFW